MAEENGIGFEMIVCEKDWENMPEGQKNWMLFNTLRSIDKRLSKVERQSFVFKSCAFGGGVIGGIAAALGIKWWG
jgi:hypothetical protein